MCVFLNKMSVLYMHSHLTISNKFSKGFKFSVKQYEFVLVNSIQPSISDMDHCHT